MELVYQEKYVEIHYEASQNRIATVWNAKFLTNEQFKKASNAMLGIVIEKQCTQALADLTNMGVIPMESQRWTQTDLFPRLCQTSMQFCANVLSKDVFNKVAINSMVSKMNGTQLVITNFITVKEASDWLSLQKALPIAS
jgi:hypothetical protein